jgi:hypothetical protein
MVDPHEIQDKAVHPHRLDELPALEEREGLGRAVIRARLNGSRAGALRLFEHDAEEP